MLRFLLVTDKSRGLLKGAASGGGDPDLLRLSTGDSEEDLLVLKSNAPASPSGERAGDLGEARQLAGRRMGGDDDETKGDTDPWGEVIIRCRVGGYAVGGSRAIGLTAGRGVATPLSEHTESLEGERTTDEPLESCPGLIPSLKQICYIKNLPNYTE
jgi:hypothetical protein